MIFNRFIVYTPLIRYHNLTALTGMLATKEVSWHLIYDEEAPLRHEPLSWISHSFAPRNPSGWHPSGWKDNWFLDHEPIDDHALYLHFSDDDWYEPDFFEKLDRVGADVMIVTMRNAPTPQGPRTDLMAQPENLRGSRIGAQQIAVRGSIIRNFRYGPAYDGDWDFINAITQKHPPVYVPEANVFWNYL